MAGGCEHANELLFSINVGNFLTSRGTIRFSRRAVLHGVTVFVPLGAGERMRNYETENAHTTTFVSVLTHKRKRFLDPLQSGSGSAVS